MRSVAAEVVFLITLAGCAAEGPVQATTVVFDGESYTIDGPASCVRQVNGKLAIDAPVHPKWGGVPMEGGRKLIRVVLTDAQRLVVESAGIRLGDVRGFSDVPDDMWATKADNNYTINGRMAPDDGSRASHQFKIEVTCVSIENQYLPVNPPPG
ncbi:MAG: hypothetical protein QOD39_2738 [Mycobacterium sp.]|jgi:hypothetical protein|nr:hypothetical protein [Mycobacterium sp.]